MKIVKTIALVIGALLIVLLALAAYLATTFDPNDYKSTLIQRVQEKTQRTLTIPGEIRLSFFPRLGADLGQVAISEKNSQETFASIDSMQASLALLPLLSGQVVVDRVRIDGLRATVLRKRDGAVNVEDLITEGAEESGKAEPENGQIALNVAGIELTNAHLVYDDRQQGRRVELQDLNLATDQLADGVPSELQLRTRIQSNEPKLDARIAAKTGFTLFLNEKRYVVRGLDAQLSGAFAGITDADLKLSGNADLKPADKRFAVERMAMALNGKRAGQPFEMTLDLPQLAVTDARVAGGELSGKLKMSDGTRQIAATFGAPAFDGSPQAFRVPALELNANVTDTQLDLRATLSGAVNGDIDKLIFSSPQMALRLTGTQDGTPIKGTLATPLSVNLERKTIDLPKLAADFSMPNPAGGSMAVKAAGQAGVQLARETVSATLNGSVDQSAFNAKLSMTGFSTPAYKFDIGIDQLDLDRYRQVGDAQAKPTGERSTTKPGANGQAAEQPIDLSPLRELRANGSLRVGALKAGGVKASKVRVDLQAAAGKLEISPMTANLYGGTANGALTISATNPARYAVRQTLSGVNVGSLLKDGFDQDVLDGRGDVQLDVRAAGATKEQIMRAMDGTARVMLRDGAVRGVNVAQTLRGAKASVDALRGKETAAARGTGSASEKTDFSELSASFRITDGVARNDDLSLKSPLIRLTGSGEIDLAAERVDYVARTTVVPTLQGQGGPELQALKGVTVPVRLTGPFDAVAWRVDAGAMVTELAKQKFDERKDELKAKVQEEIKEQLRGLFKR